MSAMVPAPGQVVRIADEDYRYGLGQITFRIAEVGNRFVHDNSTWISLKGYKLYPNGWGTLRDLTARIGGIVIVAPKAKSSE